MAALMGPSGSGKSTLLDILSGRKNSGKITGTVKLNGTPLAPRYLKNHMGYVEQFDTLVSELTVEQMLSYTAALKLPARLTPFQRKQRVDEVILKLDLSSCRHTVIGNALSRGISGGQAKRVNIGLAMIDRPRVLLLDEPTSGLDSRTADEVIYLLRQLAKEGRRTVVCTIHSPTGRAFSNFDDLHMLHAGRTIYDGMVRDVTTYFESMGYEKHAEQSLPEWLVDLTASDFKAAEKRVVVNDGDERHIIKKPTDFAATYEKSHARRSSLARMNSVTSENLRIERIPPSEVSKLFTLLRYRMVAHYKDGQFLGTRFGDKVVFALLILSLYWGIGNDPDPQAVQSTSSLLYFICAICGYGAAAFVPSLTLERSLYYRELADGCYKPATYYASKFVEEGVLATLTSLTFCVIVHFSCDLQGSFVIFALTYYLTTMIGIILAYAVAALAPTMEAANAILPTFVTVWMYFGGLFIVFDKIPQGWYWFSWTSFLRYSWGALMLNQFDGETTGEEPVFFGKDGQALGVLEFYGLEGPVMGSLPVCLALLTVLIVVFSFIGVMGLVFIRHEKR